MKGCLGGKGEGLATPLLPPSMYAQTATFDLPISRFLLAQAAEVMIGTDEKVSAHRVLPLRVVRKEYLSLLPPPLLRFAQTGSPWSRQTNR